MRRAAELGGIEMSLDERRTPAEADAARRSSGLKESSTAKELDPHKQKKHGGSGVAGSAPAPIRHFTVAVFVVSRGLTLLLYHRTHGMWLPPGGHIEPDETPDEAAVREVSEEVGLDVVLVGERGLAVDRPTQLVTPEGVQLESIGPATDNHQHIDLVYFSAPRLSLDDGVSLRIDPCEVIEARWCSPDDLNSMDLAADVREWALRALRVVPQRLAASKG